MVAQWVKDQAKAIKGTAQAKRIGAKLHSDKAAKKAGETRMSLLNEYRALSGRDPMSDFEEWVGVHWTLAADQLNNWLSLRISELNNGDDWKKETSPMIQYHMTVKHDGGEFTCTVPEMDFLVATTTAENIFWNAHPDGEIINVKGSLVSGNA